MSFYKIHGSRNKEYRKSEFSTISDLGGTKSIPKPRKFQFLQTVSCRISKCSGKQVEFKQVWLSSMKCSLRPRMYKIDIESKPNQLCFNIIFKPECQREPIHNTLNILISMVLNGPGINREEQIYSQTCHTICRLIVFNSKNKTTLPGKKIRHSLTGEPPLPIYFGLEIHAGLRSKKLVDRLFNLGMSISYDRVQQIERQIEITILKRFQSEGVVCPSQLRKGLFLVRALDNIDHNPSSTILRIHP